MERIRQKAMLYSVFLEGGPLILRAQRDVLVPLSRGRHDPLALLSKGIFFDHLVIIQQEPVAQNEQRAFFYLIFSCYALMVDNQILCVAWAFFTGGLYGI
jgi:hypothetical protein